MGQNFGVGLGGEIAITVPDQLIFQRLVIFNHAVVHERELSRGVEVRMRVLVGRLSMSRPAGVADAISTGERFRRHELAELGDASGAFPGLNAIAVYDRDAGGIVAAIFKAAQTIEENGSGLRTSDVSNYATHEGESVTLRDGRCNQRRRHPERSEAESKDPVFSYSTGSLDFARDDGNSSRKKIDGRRRNLR